MFLSHTNIVPNRPKLELKYVQIIIWGLNYNFSRVKRRRTKVCLDLQCAFDNIMLPPRGVVMRIYKRRLVMCGFNALLMTYVKYLISLRPGNIYTGKGLRLRRTPYETKPGKIRKRN